MKIADLTKEQLIEEVKKLRARKKYGLVWEDKPEEVAEQCKKQLPVLEEVKSREIITNEETPTNLIIEGDNYHSLSVLNYTHQEKVDVIYIDPPYNTGHKDFIYNDQFVDMEDAYRHSKWLSFMSKRLQLARNLLKEEGVIFISIDDNEQSNLKMLCDKEFGEENFISMLSVENNPKGRKNSTYISVSSEYCLIYAKNKYIGYFDEVIPKDEKDMIKDNKGNYVHNSGKRVLVGENKFNKIVTNFDSGKHYSVYYSLDLDDFIIKKEQKLSEIDKELISKGYRRYVSYLKNNFVENTYTSDKLKSLFNEDKLDIKDEKIYEKNFSSLTRLKSILTNKKYKAIVNNRSVGYEIDLKTTSAQQELKEMLGKDVFSFPKNVSFIKLLAQLCPTKDAIVLDYFAGSGTTGHAVLKLNKEDGGNRKFILCTNNEGSIAEEVTYPRIKAVIKGFKDTKGIPANVRYFKTCFVSKSNVSDDTRNSLVRKSTEMICVREDTFDKVLDKKEYKLYRNNNLVTGILFDLDELDKFKEELDKLKLPTHIYVFSLTNDTYTSDFENLKAKHKLCPIPESILEVYRKLFKE